MTIHLPQRVSDMNMGNVNNEVLRCLGTPAYNLLRVINDNVVEPGQGSSIFDSPVMKSSANAAKVAATINM